MNLHQRHPILLAALLLSATALTACHGEPGTAAPAATRDSAGAEIITSVRPLWDSLPAWSIDSVPALTIGRTEGPEEYLFSWVTAAFGRDDGSIVAFDRSASSFRAYDSTGTYLKAAGRKGPGPGEFNGVQGIARCGSDALWVQTQQRISIWGTDLTFRREFAVADDRMWPLICFGGTALLVKEDVHRPGEDPENVLYDDSLHLRVLDSVGGARGELLTARLWSYINIPKGGIGFPHPFGSQLLLGQHGTTMIVGPADELGFRSYASDGRLLRIVRGPAEPLEVTSAVKEAYIKAELTDREAIEKRKALALLDYPMPRTFPAYTALQVDTEGNVWLRRFEIPGTPERRWAVFRVDGRFLGHLTMPPDIEVLEIGDDYLLARGKGADDEPQVRRYRVRK